MKNYELIMQLEKYPAGAEIVFWGEVPETSVDAGKEGSYGIRAEIKDSDINGGIITLST